MAIDERARHQLYLRLEEHLGAEAATTLMEHLPPTGWADVATKRDLDHLRTTVSKTDLDRHATHRADADSRAESVRLDKAMRSTFTPSMLAYRDRHVAMPHRRGVRGRPSCAETQRAIRSWMAEAARITRPVTRAAMIR